MSFRVNRKPSAGDQLRAFIMLIVCGWAAYWMFTAQPIEGWAIYGLASGGIACLAFYTLAYGYPE